MAQGIWLFLQETSKNRRIEAQYPTCGAQITKTMHLDTGP